MRLFPRKAVLPTLSAPARPKARSRRSYIRLAFRGLVAGIAIALAVEAARVLFVGNFHTIIPGRAYRSAQLSGDDLRDAIKSNGIRTIINLRGRNPWMDWYKDECAIAHELNV